MAFTSGSGGQAGPLSEINVTPLVDVMLVLLIIFMVTATVITPGAINVPSAGKSQKAPDKRIDLMMNEDGQLSLGGELSAREVTETEAIVRIKEALASNPELPVMLAADRELRYQQVVTMMRKLREAGVQRVGLSVK